MDFLVKIKEDLPNFPDEIIISWLLPNAKNLGWPPNQRSDWQYLLMDKPSDYWQEIVWEKVEVELLNFEFTSSILQNSNRMIDDYIKGCDSFGNSPKRISNVVDYLVKTGKFPLAPIIIFTSSGYDLADGHHRLAAYRMCVVQQLCKLQQTVWIGKLPSEEKDFFYEQSSFYW